MWKRRKVKDGKRGRSKVVGKGEGLRWWEKG